MCTRRVRSTTCFIGPYAPGVLGLTRGEEMQVLMATPAGHSALVLVVYCVSYHEWIEVYNGSGQSVDLGGWMLDDEPEGGAVATEGTLPHIMSAGTIIDPGGYAVFCRSDTGVALNNDGDQVRFLGPDGRLLDSVTYYAATRDGSWSRTVDGAGHWTPHYPPSPGASHQPQPHRPPPSRRPPHPTRWACC